MEVSGQDFSVGQPTPVAKAPEDWRSPRPGGFPHGLGVREASWTAVALYRFSDGSTEEVPRKF